jgi:hypothetical protein
MPPGSAIGPVIARWYRAVALAVLNSVIVLVLVNGALYPFLRPPHPPETLPRLAGEAFEAAVENAVGGRTFESREKFFPRLSREEVVLLVFETYARPFVYEPFTQFAERPFRGRYVNVDTRGFRLGRRQGPWPPDGSSVNVFVFGGSTAFGTLLPDDETIASHLQTLLARAGPGDRVRVYNFARGHYFSSQERVLFENLLLLGVKPDLAVFVDGLNDFFYSGGEPFLTPRLRDFVEGRVGRCPAPVVAFLEELPLARAARWMRQMAAPSPRPGTLDAAAAHPADPAVVENVIRRYLANKQLIDSAAAAYGVQAVFVWQPVPTYKYDLRYHEFAGTSFGRNESTRTGYPAMARVAAGGQLGSNFLWCADIQEHLKEPLYLDQVHYTPRMARRFARCIARQMIERGLVRSGTRT